MTQNQLFGLLRTLIILTSISLITFIIGVQIVKYVSYGIEVNRAVNYVNKDDGKNIQTIKHPTLHYEDSEYLQYDQNKAHSPRELNYQDDFSRLQTVDWSEGINILLTGSDKNDFHVNRSRADVIIILRITKDGKILSISIPRDTLITIEDRNNNLVNDKIGHALYWNGLDGLKNSCELLLGSPIYKVVIIDNFKSFEAFLSIIGSVNIDKKLEGKLGVQWIRNRNFKNGDIDRCQRQQVFLKKTIEKAWKISGDGNPFVTTFLFSTVRKIIQTDLSEKDFMNILFVLRSNQFNPQIDFYSTVLPGKFSTFYSPLMRRDNLSCWKLDESIPQFLSLLFYSPEASKTFIHSMNIGYFDFIKHDMRNILKNDKEKVARTPHKKTTEPMVHNKDIKK